MPRKTRQPDALETIDLGVLQTVSGGRTSATAAAAKSSSGGTSQRTSATAPTTTSSDPMMQLLTQIEASLQSMTQSNSTGDDPFMKAMLAMGMMKGRY